MSTVEPGLVPAQEVARRLETENAELRQLTKLQPSNAVQSLSAQVIADSGGAFARNVLINAGSNDGIPDGRPYATLAAMDPGFLGGVRVAVGHFTSTTTLQVAVVAGPGGGPRGSISITDGFWFVEPISGSVKTGRLNDAEFQH